ncbi:hypothetical protein [Streptococcus agalactiae]|nr:hypothetical protein [Streptococcus agalactiae]CQJ54699.1 phage protein [Streptococcus agalactiae]
MNTKEKIVVLRNTEDGSFLKSFKNKKDVLAYNVELTDSIHLAGLMSNK